MSNVIHGRFIELIYSSPTVLTIFFLVIPLDLFVCLFVVVFLLGGGCSNIIEEPLWFS